MYNINDCVIHKTAGACVICDVVEKDFGIGLLNYYYIKPKFPTLTSKTLEIYLPVDKENVFLRPPMDKLTANKLIDSFTSIDSLPLLNERKRKQRFEEIFHNGDVQEMCRLIKLLYLNPEELEKPLTINERDYITKIKNIVFGEFSYVLEVDFNEIETYIVNKFNIQP